MEKRLKAQNIFSEYPMLFQIENKASLPFRERDFIWNHTRKIYIWAKVSSNTHF